VQENQASDRGTHTLNQKSKAYCGKSFIPSFTYKKPKVKKPKRLKS